jgi:predicted MFS family arabinose efflux permease
MEKDVFLLPHFICFCCSGWRGSHLINAGICLHFFFFALIMKSRPADPTQLKPRLSQLMGVQVLASVKFRLYLLHIILWNIGFIIVFSLLNSFVKDVGGLTDGEANLISMFVGILNTVGRIASVPLERFFNPIKLYVAMTILMGLFEMLIAAGVTQAGYTITSSAAGMFFGIMVGLRSIDWLIQ